MVVTASTTARAPHIVATAPTVITTMGVITTVTITMVSRVA